jgi:uncharacterized protein
MTSTCRVVVMAKAPVAGYAKTRLIPTLGAAGAAALALRLLQSTVSQALAADIGPVTLCCTPDTLHPAFAALSADGRVGLDAQCSGDLGQRMAAAVRTGLQHAGRVILIGTDVPALDAAHLRQAAAALLDLDAVITPAADGGYALIGMHRLQPRLFDALPWSTPQVLALTRERLNECGLRFFEMPVLHDIDEAADLVHLPAGWL